MALRPRVSSFPSGEGVNATSRISIHKRLEIVPNVLGENLLLAVPIGDSLPLCRAFFDRAVAQLGRAPRSGRISC